MNERKNAGKCGGCKAGKRRGGFIVSHRSILGFEVVEVAQQPHPLSSHHLRQEVVEGIVM